MKIIPTGDRILALITPLTALGERESVIVIPDQAKERKLVQAIVMDLGPEVEVKPKIKEHSVVLINVFAGTRVKSGEDELILVASREILAVVDLEVEEGS